MYVSRRFRAFCPGGPRPAVPVALVAVTAACVPAQRIEIEPTGPGYERTRWQTVAVFGSGHDVQRDFETLGLMRVETPGDRPTPRTVDRLRQRASEVGANAIVLAEIAPGTTEDSDATSEPGWRGVATAIRILDSRWGDRYWRYAPPLGALTEPVASEPEVTGWQRLQSWRGNGDRDTESFAIPPGEWRVQWHAATPEKGNLEILVFSLPGEVLTARIGQDGGGAGSYLGLAGGGTYFLRVHGEGVAWEVSVDTWTSGAP